MTQTPQLKISTLFLQTGQFLAHHFIMLLLATVAPFLLSYALMMITIGAVLFNTTTFDELVSLVSFTSPASYTLLIVVFLMFALNIVSWVAGPIITITQTTLTIRALLSKVGQYFWSYFLLAILTLLGVVVIFIGLFLVSLILGTIAGFIDIAYAATFDNYFFSIVPGLALIIYMMMMMLAPYFLIDKNLTAWQAMQRSLALSWHHFANLLIRYILVLAIILLVSFVLQFIPVLGFALSYIVSSLLLTVYNYYLYKGLTDSDHGA